MYAYVMIYSNRADAGVMMSMNGGGGNPELLTDHMYTVCIAQNDKMCDVALTASTFMLGGTAGSCTAADDKIVLGADTQCGATLGTSNSLTCKKIEIFPQNV